MPMLRPTALALALTALAVPGFSAGFPGIAAANVQHSTDNRYVASARAHYDAGRLREAAIELKNALRQNSGDAAARFLLGKVLFDQGDLPGALKELSRANELSQSDESALLLAEVQNQLGQYREALKTVEGDGATVAATVERLTLRGASLTALDRFDEAEAAYRRILQIDPRRVEGHFGIAQVHAVRKDYTAAADKLDEIVKGKPDFTPGWMLRGEVALANGDKQAAFVAFDKAVSLSPDGIAPLVARARAHLAAGDLDRAREDSARVTALAPEAPIAYYLKSALAFADGDLDAANRSFTQLQRNFDRFAPAILLGALIKHQRGEHNQADSLLTRYIAIEPGNIEARRALAAVRLRSGRPSSAVDILKTVLSRAPNDTGSLRQLASAYLALDDYASAERTFRSLAETGSPRERGEAELAIALLNPQEGDLDPALQNASVRRALLKAVDLMANGDAAGADTVVGGLDPETPQSANILSLKGSIAAAKGETDRARALLDQALALNPEHGSALGAYEQLDELAGTAERILPRLHALLEKAPRSELLTLSIAQRMGIEGDRQGATAFLAARAAAIPESVELGRALVSALMVQDRYQEAADTAMRLAQAAPKDPEVLLFATNTLIDARDAGRAAQVAERLARLAPKSARARTLLAEAQAAAGQPDRARETLVAARKQWPDDVGIAASLVGLEAARRNPEGVKAAADALARRNPAAAARLRASALADMGQPVMAVEALERAFAETPDQRLAVDLFSYRRRAGRDDAAFADLAKWVDRHPEDRAALMTYATGLLEVGSHEKAAKAYEAFLALEPGNPIALNNYAWLRHRTGRPDALDYAQRAYEAASGSPEIADTYGWMLVQYGKLKEGLALLKTAREAAPESPDIQYHYAFALSKAGHRDEAQGDPGRRALRPGELRGAD